MDAPPYIQASQDTHSSLGGLDFILLIPGTLVEIILDSQHISYNTHYRKYPWTLPEGNRETE